MSNQTTTLFFVVHEEVHPLMQVYEMDSFGFLAVLAFVSVVLMLCCHTHNHSRVVPMTTVKV